LYYRKGPSCLSLLKQLTIQVPARKLLIMEDRSDIVLYDGACNLCNGLIRSISGKLSNREILFLPLQSAEGKSLLQQYELPAGDPDTVVFIREGKTYLRSSAILHIAKEMKGLWKGFFALILIPRFIRDFLYTLIAKSRYRFFGRQDSCEYPIPQQDRSAIMPR